MNGTMAYAGRVAARKISVARPGWLWLVVNFWRHVWAGLWRHALARALGMNHLLAELRARLIRADGTVVDYGLICTRKVTDAYVALLVDELQASQAAHSTFKYHDAGTGVGAEAAGDTGLGTAWGGARVTGTQTEGATANIYKSVGTIAFNSGFAITEHGLFSASTGATLMDRSVFAAINVISGDSIEFSYSLTCTSGG
jgi:hypothetical protein